MNIKRALVCAPRVPEFDRESGSRRVFHLIEFLQEAGWVVCFIAQDGYGSERYVRLLQQRGVETLVGFGPETEQLIEAGCFDVVIIAFWHLAEKYIPVIRRLSPNTRVIVDMIDLHLLRDARRILGSRNGQPPTYKLDIKYASAMVGELNVYAMADAVLAVSQKEADLVNDFIGDPSLAHVVPDNEDLPASTVPFGKRNGIVFIGNFWHEPNVSAAKYLCREVLPKLDPALLTEHPVYIVGNALDDVVRGFGRNLSNVRFVGWVPSILPYVNQSRVSVIPLLAGAGTKRKLIQALMVGTPTVSTSIGTEGLNLEKGKHVLVADDPGTFAESIEALLKNPDLWQRLSSEGRKHVIHSHSRQNASASLMLAIAAAVDKEPKTLTPIVPDPRSDAEATEEATYAQSVQRIKGVVEGAVPENATVLVVSNGDDDLIKFGERKAWHFPQGENGMYAGYHPANSTEAITHLETLRKKGGDYLLFPSTAFWWLEYYSDFKQHLESRYGEILRDETCAIFTLREVSTSSEREASCSIDKHVIASLRPNVPAILKEIRSNGQSRQKRVLVLGVYLAGKPNNIDDIVEIILSAKKYKVTQRWIALGGEPLTKQVANVTVGTVLREKPKFQIMNDLLAKEKLSQYDYVILIDDDVVLPASFVDQFIALQERLEFSISQPARTSNSYIDHPIVEQQRGVLARRTLFVEIGPVVSFHKSVYEQVFPFDLTSPMGWGYENVWAYRLDQLQLKMGIIDIVPVDHSLRKPVAFYSWDEANRQRSLFLSKHDHIPTDQCFRVLDVIGLSSANKEHGNAIAAY
jgi:glycosyltransferase involved in cell wall biosynthesis